MYKEISDLNARLTAKRCCPRGTFSSNHRRDSFKFFCFATNESRLALQFPCLTKEASAPPTKILFPLSTLPPPLPLFEASGDAEEVTQDLISVIFLSARKGFVQSGPSSCFLLLSGYDDKDQRQSGQQRFF